MRLPNLQADYSTLKIVRKMHTAMEMNCNSTLSRPLANNQTWFADQEDLIAVRCYSDNRPEGIEFETNVAKEGRKMNDQLETS